MVRCSPAHSERSIEAGWERASVRNHPARRYAALRLPLAFFSPYVSKQANTAIMRVRSWADGLFDMLFWFVAVPLFVSGMVSVWNRRPVVLRVLTSIVIGLIILWHACLVYQTYTKGGTIVRLPTILPWPLEVVSIAMGIVLAVFGLNGPTTATSICLGCIGVCICIGHGSVLFGWKTCYYLC